MTVKSFPQPQVTSIIVRGFVQNVKTAGLKIQPNLSTNYTKHTLTKCDF